MPCPRRRNSPRASWREIAARSGEVVLCLEMVYTRNQKILDRFMAGQIGEAEFLKGIRYELDWGYDWNSFRRLFDAARENRRRHRRNRL